MYRNPDAIRLFILTFSLLLLCAKGASVSADSTMLFNGFEDTPTGRLESAADASGQWDVGSGDVLVSPEKQRSGRRALRMQGGVDVLVWTPADAEGEPYELTFWAERWSKHGPFEFRVEAYDGAGWREVYQGDNTITVGGYNTQVVIPLEGRAPKRIRFRCASEPGRGVLIDDIRISRRVAMTVESVTCEPTGMPVLIGNQLNPVAKIRVNAPGNVDTLTIQSITLALAVGDDMNIIEAVEVYGTAGRAGIGYREPAKVFESNELFGEAQPPAEKLVLEDARPLADGENYFWVSYRLAPGATQTRAPAVRCESITLSDGRTIQADTIDKPQHTAASRRIGIALRNTGDHGVASYRIPGLVTTRRGTLIAVYDVRHDGWGDLPGNIDIGMNRSTDGGRTWKPMQVICDMGDDPAWAYDGVGDPAIMVDEQTGTIWVAGLWSHGERGWAGSGPGMTPEETGQLVLVRSDDDGVTWSDPINITAQVKDPAWRLMFQGPGAGICMRDGTLVFPAQFKDADNMPHATIIYSKDHGRTWHAGTGAKSNTTEAQVVELSGGRLMLNMRDNRGGSRSVCVSDDLGRTWTEHPTSRSALPEPVCQASILRVDRAVGAAPLLLFSNPAVSNKPRRDMTIKASLDGGNTWPQKYHLLIDAGESAGYSCLTMIDESAIGILYEGSRANMTFLRIPLAEVLGE